MRSPLAALCLAASIARAQAAPAASPAGVGDSATIALETLVRDGRPGAPRAVQELIAIHACAGRRDDALRWLTRAREIGADWSGIAARPEVATLRDDPRFAVLFPSAAELAHPFVEPVRVLHEWHGAHVGDSFGWIARGIGDVDGDGAMDVVVSAPANPPHGDVRGRLYVYSGRTGALRWSRDGEPGWVLGTSLESAGDVDGDGVPDVIAGAPGKALALVLSGRDGHELWRLHGDSAESNFGGAVAGVGDVDHDGRADVIVGASGTSATQAGAGRAIVFSGRTGARLRVLDGERAGDAFGSAVTGADGDLLAIGAPGAGPAHHGRVYLFGATGDTPRAIEDADSTGVALGAMFVAVVGDVDGDHHADVFASDFANGAGGRGAGRGYVYSGATGRVLLTVTGDTPGEALGTSASRAVDVDGDGRADLAVGSWQYGGAAWSGGRITVFSGRDGHVLRRITGRVAGETLGFDAVGIGDVDRDGAVDFLVTSAYSTVNGARSGRAYVIAGERAPHASKRSAQRSTPMASARVARRIGATSASPAHTSSATAAPPNVTGSKGVTP